MFRTYCSCIRPVILVFNYHVNFLSVTGRDLLNESNTFTLNPKPVALWRLFEPEAVFFSTRLSQSPSHDFFRFWYALREGLFIPAARQILRVEFCPRGVICGPTNQMRESQVHVNQAGQSELPFVWHLRRDARKPS